MRSKISMRLLCTVKKQQLKLLCRVKKGKEKEEERLLCRGGGRGGGKTSTILFCILGAEGGKEPPTKLLCIVKTTTTTITRTKKQLEIVCIAKFSCSPFDKRRHMKAGSITQITPIARAIETRHDGLGPRSSHSSGHALQSSSA